MRLLLTTAALLTACSDLYVQGYPDPSLPSEASTLSPTSIADSMASGDDGTSTTANSTSSAESTTEASPSTSSGSESSGWTTSPSSTTLPSPTTGQPGCDDNFRLVFVSEPQSGNLGGIAGADAICNAEAASAGLDGTWMAWLGGERFPSPSERFTKFDGCYVLPSGETIAYGWNDLIDGMLLAPPNSTALGEKINAFAWTGVKVDGTTTNMVIFCNDWTTSDETAQGWIASPFDNLAGWTHAGGSAACNVMNHIYCFQQ